MNARYRASKRSILCIDRRMLLSLLTPSVFTLVQHPFDINALTPFRGRLKAPCMAAWSDPEWRWGCADGTAHAVATRLKTSLSTAEARSRFLTDVGMLDEEDWEDSKVVLTPSASVQQSAAMQRTMICVRVGKFSVPKWKACRAFFGTTMPLPLLLPLLLPLHVPLALDTWRRVCRLLFNTTRISETALLVIFLATRILTITTCV